MERLERLTESVIKSVLELLKTNPQTEFSELQIEQGTREKVLNKPVILDRLRKNPKIAYNSTTGRYRFRPTYAISNRDDLIELIKSKAALFVDSDLLECYKGVHEDVSSLLVAKLVRAVRQGDAERAIKCQIASLEATKKSVRVNTLPKCSLYSDRCPTCSDNKGLILMRMFNDSHAEPLANDLKELWFSQELPHISEIQRTAASNDRALQQHLGIASTQHILQRKLKAGAVRGRRKRANDGQIKPESLSNDHLAEHFTQ